MKRRFVLTAGVVLVLCGTAMGRATASDRRSAGPECGDTITVDTRLSADLRNCAGDGIVIGADGITLDLNGHTIDGDATVEDACLDNGTCDVGVDNGAGHSGVTVRDGTIREFGFGAVVGGADGTRLSLLRLTDHVFSGVLVLGTTNLRIERDVVARNGVDTDFSGIAAFGMSNGLVARSRITDNGDIGFYAEDIDGNRIVANTFTGNPESGVIFNGPRNVVSRNRLRLVGDGIAFDGDHNRITANRITGEPRCSRCGYGILFGGGSGTLVASNQIAGAGWGIGVEAFTGLARGTVVRRNVVRGSANDNLLIGEADAGPVEATLVQRNHVTRAGDDGIDVATPSTTLAANVANRNDDLGIEAVAGVTDGGRNRAAGNGNPLQCTNVDC